LISFSSALETFASETGVDSDFASILASACLASVDPSNGTPGDCSETFAPGSAVLASLVLPSRTSVEDFVAASSGTFESAAAGLAAERVLSYFGFLPGPASVSFSLSTGLVSPVLSFSLDFVSTEDLSNSGSAVLVSVGVCSTGLVSAGVGSTDFVSDGLGSGDLVTGDSEDFVSASGLLSDGPLAPVLDSASG